MAKKKDEREVRKAYREMRRWLGLTQIALAKSAGLSSDKLARWEKGQAKFIEEDISKLGSALDAATIVRAETVKGPLAGSGVAVRSLRKSYGITQQQLARRAGMTQAAISLFENGWDALDPQEAKQLYAACEELVRERDHSRPSGVPLGTALGGGPGKKGRGCVESLQEKIRTNQDEIIADLKKIIEEYKAEITRLELLNKEISESKDREIEQLQAKNAAVTVPATRHSGQTEE